MDPGFRSGDAQQWQVSVQHDLPASLTVLVSYDGAMGRHLMQAFLPNTYPAGAVNPCPSCPAGFVYVTSNGSSLRNTAQFTLRRRLHSGLTASVQYTLSKSTDDAATFSSRTIAPGSLAVAQNWLDLGAERGPSSFDERHVVTAQVQYTTGQGTAGGTLVDGVWGALFKDWTITSEFRRGSGLPFTPVWFAAVTGTGIVGVRPASDRCVASAGRAGVVCECGCLRRAAGWGLGQRRPQFDSRPGAVLARCRRRPRVPPARPAEPRMPRGSHERAQSRDVLADRHGDHQPAVRPADLGERHAAAAGHDAAEVLKMRRSGMHVLWHRAGFQPGVIAVLASAMTAGLLAQQAPQATFRSAAHLIVQPVTVKDRSGRPIGGLTAKDFVLTEDGVPQEIAFCEYQRLDAPPGSAAFVVRRAVPRGDDGRTGAAFRRGRRGAGHASERCGAGRRYVSRTSPARLLLRSLRHGVLRPDSHVLGRREVHRLADDGRRPGGGHGLRARDGASAAGLHGRPRGVERVDPATRRRGRRENSNGGGITFNAGSAFGEDDDTFNLFSTDRQLAALQTAVTDLGPVPEIKTLVYFGSGLRLNGADNLAQLRATVNAAVRSSVTINPIDTRGLVATPPLGDATRASPSGIGMFNGAIVQAATTKQQQSQDTYYALAKDTGGRAMFDNNDLSLGIVQAARAVTGYYMLGYYTKNTAADGRYRRVKVTLAGGLAAALSYRAGYYGAKDYSRFNAADRERQLEEALRAEDPITDIPMAAEVNYFQISSAEYFVPISVRMPGSELTRPRPKGDTHAEIDMIGEIKDEYGATIRNARDKLEFTLDPAKAADVARRPIQYETGFSLLPGNYVIKVLARDTTTGRIGTYQTPFVVPNLEREHTRLPTSTVVMTSQRVTRADALYTVQQKISSDVANPLVFGGQKLIPSVTRTYSAGRPLYIFLQAYERDSTSMRPLVAYVTFYRDGAKVFETDPMAVDDWNAKLRAVPIRFSIPPGSLPPGELRLPGDGARSEREQGGVLARRCRPWCGDSASRPAAPEGRRYTGRRELSDPRGGCRRHHHPGGRGPFSYVATRHAGPCLRRPTDHPAWRDLAGRSRPAHPGARRRHHQARRHLLLVRRGPLAGIGPRQTVRDLLFLQRPGPLDVSQPGHEAGRSRRSRYALRARTPQGLLQRQDQQVRHVHAH